MVNFDIASDLHIDNWWHTTKLHTTDGPKVKHHDGSPLYIDWEWYRTQAGGNGDILLIAGDLSNNINITLKTVEQAAEVYNLVIFTDGNHEHYNRQSYSSNITRLKEAKSPNNNIVFLTSDYTNYITNNIAIVGINGWYDWRCYEDKGLEESDAYIAWKQAINDFKYIFFDEGDPSKLATKHADCLSSTINELQTNNKIEHIIVMTHTSPRIEVMEWKTDPLWNIVTPSFVNSQMNNVMMQDIHKKIKCWVYGHSHTRKTLIVDDVTYVNNCRGYPRELNTWALQRFVMPN